MTALPLARRHIGRRAGQHAALPLSRGRGDRTVALPSAGQAYIRAASRAASRAARTPPA